MIIAAHGNSLRALVKYLDDIDEQTIVELNIPTGIPLVYELDDDLEADPALLSRRPGGRGCGGRARREPGQSVGAARRAEIKKAGAHRAPARRLSSSSF